MKKVNNILLTLLLVCMLPTSILLAQDDEDKGFNFAIAIVPQYAFASTMRLDFDITLKSNNVLTVAPMFCFARHSSLLFSNQNDSYFYSNEENYPQDIALTGGGLKLTLRHFFGDFNKNSGVYLGGGLHYRYSHVKYKVKDFQLSTLDDDQYSDKEEKFNQVGLDFILGYQMYFMDNVYGDLFAGWGFRLSDTDDDNDTYWSETLFDLAYSGYTPLAGLRIGIFF